MTLGGRHLRGIARADGCQNEEEKAKGDTDRTTGEASYRPFDRKCRYHCQTAHDGEQNDERDRGPNRGPNPSGQGRQVAADGTARPCSAANDSNGRTYVVQIVRRRINNGSKGHSEHDPSECPNAHLEREPPVHRLAASDYHEPCVRGWVRREITDPRFCIPRATVVIPEYGLGAATSPHAAPDTGSTIDAMFEPSSLGEPDAAVARALTVKTKSPQTTDVVAPAPR